MAEDSSISSISSILDPAEQATLRAAFLNILFNDSASASSSHRLLGVPSPEMSLATYLALHGPLDYTPTLQLVLDIQHQLELLAKDWQAGILYFRLADIVVLPDKNNNNNNSKSTSNNSNSNNNSPQRFLLADYTHFGEFDKRRPEFFRLVHPMEFTGAFLAPELTSSLEQKCLPFRARDNVSQYSLAKLAQHCLGPAISQSPAFQLTKLGTLLRRCLAPLPANRTFLYL